MAGRVFKRVGVPLAILVLTLLVPGAWPGPSVAAPAATLRFQTVPRLADVGLNLDGRTYRTDPSGSITIGTYVGLHRVGVLPPSMPGGMTARPDGWLGEHGIPQEISLTRGMNVEHVSFIVSRPVSVVVTDQAGRLVPAGQVTRVTLSNSLGQRFTMGPDSPRLLLPINGIVHPRPGYVSVPVRYSVLSVLVDGGDVVHRGSQTFRPQTSGTLVIKALIFPLRIRVRDALFGFPIGRAVVLAPHSGTARTLTLGPGHAVRVASLPRGGYDLTARGPGFGLTSVTTVSRPQDAKVLLFSWVDVGTIAAFAALFLVGLPLLSGRLAHRPGRLVRWRERRVRDAAGRRAS